MNTSVTTRDDLPDLEDLAAYLDGRLQGPSRDAVEKRLAEDADYYEIFVESVRFREEELHNASGKKSADLPSESGVIGDSWQGQNVNPQGSSVAKADTGEAGSDRSSETVFEVVEPRGPTSRWKRTRSERWRQLGIAAVFVMVVFGISKLTGDSSLRLPADFDSGAAVDHPSWGMRNWSVYRGQVQLPLHVNPDEAAFRLGANLTALDVALRAERRDQALGESHWVIAALDRIEIFGPSIAYHQLQRALEEGVAVEELRDVAGDRRRDLEKTLKGATNDAMAFGEWSERARLAALIQDGAALRAQLDALPEGLLEVESIQGPLRKLLALQVDEGNETAFDEAVKLLGDIQHELGG